MSTASASSQSCPILSTLSPHVWSLLFLNGIGEIAEIQHWEYFSEYHFGWMSGKWCCTWFTSCGSTSNNRKKATSQATEQLWKAVGLLSSRKSNSTESCVVIISNRLTWPHQSEQLQLYYDHWKWAVISPLIVKTSATHKTWSSSFLSVCNANPLAMLILTIDCGHMKNDRSIFHAA